MAGQLMGEAFHALLRMSLWPLLCEYLLTSVFIGRASEDTDPDGTRAPSFPVPPR